MLREIAGSWIVVPIGQRIVEFNGLMNLSESGAFLWGKLVEGAKEQELITSILEEYDIDEATVRADVQEYISRLSESGLIEQWV